MPAGLSPSDGDGLNGPGRLAAPPDRGASPRRARPAARAVGRVHNFSETFRRRPRISRWPHAPLARRFRRTGGGRGGGHRRHGRPVPQQGDIVRAHHFNAGLWLACGLLLLAGGDGLARERRLENRHGVQARDLDPGQKGLVTGVGIEAHDIQSMTNQMARDMFASGFLNGLERAPRVLVDEQEFRNEGSQIINRRMITQRLMTELNRAAQGRMSFVGQRYAGMVAKQRELKREGTTDVGTTGLTGGQAGIDFFLAGALMTLDSRDPASGVVQRYNQIAFELVDAETGAVVWAGMYEFQRAAADDVVYR